MVQGLTVVESGREHPQNSERKTSRPLVKVTITKTCVQNRKVTKKVLKPDFVTKFTTEVMTARPKIKWLRNVLGTLYFCSRPQLVSKVISQVSPKTARSFSPAAVASPPQGAREWVHFGALFLAENAVALF